jgi:hypothetical protein
MKIEDCSLTWGMIRCEHRIAKVLHDLREEAAYESQFKGAPKWNTSANKRLMDLYNDAILVIEDLEKSAEGWKQAYNEYAKANTALHDRIEQLEMDSITSMVNVTTDELLAELKRRTT